MSELVTGEAVVLGLRPAKLPSRTLAVCIDLLVAFAAYVAVTMALTAATSSLDEAANAAVSVATFMLVLVGLPIVVETLSRGRSLGKLVCGLRVVRDDGGPVRFRHALVRGAVGAVEILASFGVIAVIASLVSARGRRLGDVFAGTLVVRERVPASRVTGVPQAPPWLDGRFTGLDLSRVPDALWLAVRQYFARMDQLDPEVNGALAQRLAADMAACTATPVPGDVPPAMYLAAVVGERQTRDARRAFAGPEAAGPGGVGPGPGGVGPGPGGVGPGVASPAGGSSAVAGGIPAGGPPSAGAPGWAPPVAAAGRAPAAASAPGWAPPGGSAPAAGPGGGTAVGPVPLGGEGSRGGRAPAAEGGTAKRGTAEGGTGAGTGFVPPA
ncbi:RDD family protein [Streptomyces lycii]|uniref:RDD family protein n=1 Tax=Streptomyces lycii TaxID=2654337 RepID=A0ABQ7FF21_9ACTN|nr:RDD family protein [Streptomyces lycii]KAF4407415.1 RDD family protein [Streptomyces lycii]